MDLWGCFVGRTNMFMTGGLHLSGKSEAVFTLNSLQQKQWHG